MLQIIKKIITYFSVKNRWWFPIITGLSFSLCFPPFNSDTHWLLTPMPLLSFIILIPLLGFSIQNSFKKAFFQSYLYSFSVALGQYYWLVFVTVEGVWHLIVLGLFVGSAIIGLIFLGAAFLFRFFFKKYPKLYILLFPSVWVLIDYLRTLGDLGFPWSFLGYSLTSLLPLSQIASITGVWGLTFLILLANMLFWDLCMGYYNGLKMTQKWIRIGLFIFSLAIISLWGFSRMKQLPQTEPAKVSILQGNLDQFHWESNSLDTAFSVLESQVHAVSLEKPQLIISSESSLLSFVARRFDDSQRVRKIVNSSGIPLIFGSLHWDKGQTGSFYEYLVYNTAFLAEPGKMDFSFYHKIKLLPFSEAMPFEGRFPILSRVNLGESDFQRGKELKIFNIGNSIKAVPLICYEAVFPDFVRKFAGNKGNLLVMITNDGWFGKSTGPYQHAEMARMRSIENGIPIVRSANSGISMFVDAYGRITGRTGLYERISITQPVHPVNLNTIYSRYGDWFVKICFFIVLFSFALSLFKRIKLSVFRIH